MQTKRPNDFNEREKKSWFPRFGRKRTLLGTDT
jgi:hypothetical protein